MTMRSATIFMKEMSARGRSVQVPCVEVAGQVLNLTGRLLRVATPDDEWCRDVEDPARVIDALQRLHGMRVDLFSFWQRLPDSEPRHRYPREAETIAALKVETYDHWWRNQVHPKARNLVRKAYRSGIEVRRAKFDDAFVQGMTAIFNESPVRQGRPFWHYGKSAETIRHEFSRYLHRERLYGAYLEKEMVGFIMLADAGRYALLTQIISKLAHRDKSPNNALLAKAVEAAAEIGRPWLVYANWTPGPLADFKRKSGFGPVDLPRYFVPLTARGALALRLGVHRDWKNALPQGLREALKDLKRRWYAARE